MNFDQFGLPIINPNDAHTEVKYQVDDSVDLELMLINEARAEKRGGFLIDEATTLFRPNPRSKDYVFSNKNGNLVSDSGFSLTSGLEITKDGDYGFNAGSAGLPYGGITSNQVFTGYVPENKTVIQGGGNTSTFYKRVDNKIGVSSDKFAVPSMFASPNAKMNKYHRDIRFIKDNPQVTELYGSNTFELMSNGIYSGNRQHGIVATAKNNIAGEQFSNRLIDLRFNNDTTSRDVYLDMKPVMAIRPVVDYIFYLKSRGRILPDITDDFYFVTEEQYFSVQPLDSEIVYNCLKRYNSKMIDVFKFLNYVFQFYFKQEKMSWSDFRIYSGYIDSYIERYYRD